MDKVRAEAKHLLVKVAWGFQSPWIRFAHSLCCDAVKVEVTDRFQSPWIRFAHILLVEREDGSLEVSLPVAKVRARLVVTTFSPNSGFNPRG